MRTHFSQSWPPTLSTDSQNRWPHRQGNGDLDQNLTISHLPEGLELLRRFPQSYNLGLALSHRWGVHFPSRCHWPKTNNQNHKGKKQSIKDLGYFKNGTIFNIIFRLYHSQPKKRDWETVKGGPRKKINLGICRK